MSPSRLVTILLIAAVACAGMAGLAAAQEPQPGAAAAGPDGAAPFGGAPLLAAFTYQGSLVLDGSPAAGPFDFRFTLYDAATGGGQVAEAVALDDVPVAAGIFTVQLDFGAAAFDGQPRWLEVAVRPGAETGSYSVLDPRHALTAAPYALYAAAAAWQGLSAVPAGFADGVDDDTTYDAGSGLALDGTTFTADTAVLQSRVTGACAGGAAISAINADGSVACQTGGGGWSLTGNSGTTPGTHYLGTSDNQALELKVNGQRVLRLEPAAILLAAGPNLLAGYSGNSVAAVAVSQTIAGGGSDAKECGASGADACPNKVTASYGTVGGGAGNTAGASATVAGGFENTAGGWGAAILGGSDNTAGGWLATVAGGRGNTASGNYSLAAGRRAKAINQGSFVWADSTDADFQSLGQDSFNVRATGGARIIAGSGTSGLEVNNFADDSAGDNGDGIDVIANVSQGEMWAALYAENWGASPAIYADSKGTYSGYFEDSIFVAGDCVGCTMAYVAVNSGSEPLAVGDLVAADGVRPPASEGGQPILAVQRSGSAAFGVVRGRAVLVESRKNGRVTVAAQAAEGPIAAGDALFVVVSGLAQVRVNASAAAVAAGQRLTASSQPGYARGLRTVSVEGVEVAEAAGVIGVALEPLPAGQGLIWVMVSAR